MKWFSRRRPQHSGESPVQPGVQYRCKRFAIRIPVLYRSSNEPHWRSGVSQDISCTGILFRGEEALAPNSRLLLRFVVPRELAGEAPVEITCNAFVIRQEPLPHAERERSIAAAFLDFRPRYEETRREAQFQQMVTAESPEHTAALLHQLNNQLAMIVGNCDLVSPHIGEPAVRNTMETIKSAALRAAALMRELHSTTDLQT